MNCPVDGTELRLSERQGIEIDYCPQCRGVWLDRGELDKIIERTAGAQEPSPSQPTAGGGGQPQHLRPRPARAECPTPTRPPPRHSGSSPRAGASTATITGTAVKSGSPGWRRSST